MSASPSSPQMRSIRVFRLLAEINWYSHLVLMILLPVAYIYIFALHTLGKNGPYPLKLPLAVNIPDYTMPDPWGAEEFEPDSMFVHIKGYDTVNVYTYHDKNHLLVYGSRWLYFGFSLWIAWLLRGIFRSAAKGKPFDRINAKRIHRIGYILILLGLIRPLWNWSIGSLYAHHIKISGATVSPQMDFHFGSIMFGLLIMGLAYFFEYAFRLQAEQELTV
ncbi:MAG: DUF2975 domain-containing protein [Calditrichota bacterium]